MTRDYKEWVEKMLDEIIAERNLDWDSLSTAEQQTLYKEAEQRYADKLADHADYLAELAREEGV